MNEWRAEDTDAVVIGAGLAGAVAAKRLVEAGLKVVCLEQGEWPDDTQARAKERDFELSREGPYWTWNPNNRGAASDYPINESESDVSPLMWNGVGGSTLLYGAAWHRIKPSDFRVKTLDGVGDDWPLTYSDLVPYYEQVERDLAVSGIGGDPAYPPGLEYALGPSKLGSIGERVVSAHNRLGWHWWPGSNAIATRDYGALKACARYGTCMFGCPEHAKASTDLTHWPDPGTRGEAPDGRPRGTHRDQQRRASRRGRVRRARRITAHATGQGGAARGERDRQPATAARVGQLQVPRRLGQLVWARRPATDDASVRHRRRHLRGSRRQHSRSLGTASLLDAVL